MCVCVCVCMHADLYISPVSDPLGELLRGEADALQVKGVGPLWLSFGREVHEGGGRVHVQLKENTRERNERGGE